MPQSSTIKPFERFSTRDLLVENAYSAGGNRVDPLLALRGIACLIVLVGHCCIAMPSMERQLDLAGIDYTWLISPYAAVGMYMFFTLSGYLMGNAFFSDKYSLSLNGIVLFFRARVLRIAPLFYLLTAFYLLFDGPQLLSHPHGNQLLKIVTFTYNLWPFPFQAQHFWSIATEMQFYLCVPLLFALTRHCSKRGFFVLTSVLAVFLLVGAYRYVEFPKTLFSDGHTDTWKYFRKVYFPLVANFDVFFAGFWLNIFFQWQESPEASVIKNGFRSIFRAIDINSKRMHLGWGIIGALYLVSSYLFHWAACPDGRFSLFPVITALATALFIVVARSHEHNQRNEALSWVSIRTNPLRLFDVIGTLSYGIYLWHVTILDKCKTIFLTSSSLEGFFTLVFSTLAFSIVFAAVTYVGLEKPFNSLKHRPRSR